MLNLVELDGDDVALGGRRSRRLLGRSPVAGAGAIEVAVGAEGTAEVPLELVP